MSLVVVKNLDFRCALRIPLLEADLFFFCTAITKNSMSCGALLVLLALSHQ